MAATLYEPAFAVVATWFHRQRGRALLLLTVCAGFASTIFLPLAAWLVDRLGWRGALVALAGLLAVATIPPHALLLRRRPEDLGLRPDGAAAPDPTRPPPDPIGDGVTLRAALRQPTFWWLTTAFSLGTLASVAIGVHLIPFLVEDGHGAGFAATAAGLIGATQVAARVVVTLLAGRWSTVAVTAVVFGLEATALLLLLRWREPAGVLVAVVFLGAGRGVVTLMRAGLVAELYGRTHYGAIGGALALFTTGARAAAPVGAGALYVWAGGYGPVLWGLAAASALAAVAMAGVPGWRR
jgi:predicted MFS family arabinose efflux permease